MAQKVILNVRTDPAVKRAAQKAAKKLGVSLSVVVNNSLRQFVRTERIELEPLTPNKATARALLAVQKEPLGKAYDDVEDFIRDLHA